MSDIYTNKQLKTAKERKKDEFYTSYDVIHKEIVLYKEVFENKIVYCNCDDYLYSNFFKYFKDNFETLKLKKLIATNYTHPVNEQLSMLNNNEFDYEKGISKHAEYTLEKGLIVKDLKGSGSFDSYECLSLLKECDIVVTNPPFSLVRRYIEVLETFEKKYIFLGSILMLTYSYIFKLLKKNKISYGKSLRSGGVYFKVPNSYEGNIKMIDNEKHIRIGGIRWYTNIFIGDMFIPLKSKSKYYGNERKYPKYLNKEGINVNKKSDIPIDYDGIIGVPITYLDHYNNKEYKILSRDAEGCGDVPPYFVRDYKALSQDNVVRSKSLCYYEVDGKPVVPFKRVFIKKIK